MLTTILHLLKHPWAFTPYAPKGIINCARTWVKEYCDMNPADIRRGVHAAVWERDAATLRFLQNMPNTLFR